MFKLCVILSSDAPSLPLARAAIHGGADALQLRHKGAYTHAMYTLGLELVRLCNNAHIPLIVNDRLDIALCIGSAGVHLGQRDLPLSLARRLLGPGRLIGATASTLEEAAKMSKEEVDYIGFGHIFATSAKVKPYPPRGVVLLREVCSQSPIPIIAIGGITEENIGMVMQSGASGVAVQSAISGHSDPETATRTLYQRL